MMKYRKGIVYIIEGIFAGLILGASLFQIMRIDTGAPIIEEKIIERQELLSYLMAINNLTAKEEICNDNMLSSFYSLSSYILGKENRYDLGFVGESKYKLFIGVYIPPERSMKTNYETNVLGHDECISKLEGNVEDFERMVNIKECRIGNTSNNKYHILLVVPEESGESNLIFLDFDGNNKFLVGGVGKKREGPYLYNDIIYRGNQHYYIGDTPITNDTYFLYDINDEELTIKLEMEKERVINSQKIKFFVRFFTLSQPISAYDVLLFPHQIPSELIPDVITFHYSGGDVVLLDPTDFKSSYSTLFGVNPIQGTKYEYLINGNEVKKERYSPLHREGYVFNIASHLNSYDLEFKHPVPSYYKTDDIGSKANMKYYILNTTRGNTTLITYPSPQPGVYNLYVDYDNDRDFDEAPDNQSINLTADEYSYFKWNGEVYKLIYLSSTGSKGKIRHYKLGWYLNESLSTYYFPNMSTFAWRINFNNSQVCLNCTRLIGESIKTPLTKVSEGLWKGNLVIKKGIWEFTFYLVNVSSTYYLYLEKDYINRYYNNSGILFYPEKYLIRMYPSKNYVSWQLVYRVPLPYISDKINERGGDAVFIPNMHVVYYKDELNFLFNILYAISSNNLYWIKRARKVGEDSGNVMVVWNTKREYPQHIEIIMNKHFQ